MPTQIQKIKMSPGANEMTPLRLEARFIPDTLDEKARTVEMTFSTGAAVLRGGWFEEPFNEELSMDEKHIRMDRLRNGAPLLDAHNKYDNRAVIGVVRSAGMVGGQLRGTVQFDDDEDSDRIFKKVKKGILRGVSVGYRIYKMQDVTPADAPRDAPKTMRAIDWEPYEVSCVPIGADAGAGVRSESSENYVCEIIGPTRAQGERTMPPEITSTPAAPVTASPAPAAGPTPEQSRALREEGQRAERERAEEVRVACRAAGMTDEFTEKLVKDGTELNLARAAIIDEMKKKAPVVVPHAQVRIGEHNDDDIRKVSMTSAMLVRGFGSLPAGSVEKLSYKPEARADEYRSYSLLEMARECLEAKGERTRSYSKMRLAERAFASTSDFPAILENVLNKTLRDGYQAQVQTFRPLIREVEVADFKPVSRVLLGDSPALKLVGEDGEVTHGVPSDLSEKYSIASYARIVAITRQVLINDDLGAMTRVPAGFGRAASSLESDLVWAIINNNPLMNDSNDLFSSAHGNVSASGTDITIASLQELRKLMRKQKGLGAEAFYIQVKPRYLIVAPERESTAEQLVGPIVPTQASNLNPFSGKLEIIVEPRLTPSPSAGNGGAWYAAADVGQVEFLELAYLQGQRGLYSEMKLGFDVEGIEMKARLDVGAAAIEWKGVAQNAGN